MSRVSDAGRDVVSLAPDLTPVQARALREAVRRAYSAAAECPETRQAFPVGRRLAESVGYPADLLDTLPAASVDAFAGVSNVSVAGPIEPGATVLDFGCGAGLDALIAARRVGARGRVIGIDFSGSMLARAALGAAEAGFKVTFCQADGERLPLKDGSVDVALVNGIFNLNPARTALFAELARVVRPGGTIHAAELILREPLARSGPPSEAEWFA